MWQDFDDDFNTDSDLPDGWEQVAATRWENKAKGVFVKYEHPNSYKGYTQANDGLSVKIVEAVTLNSVIKALS